MAIIDNPELYFQTKIYTGNGVDDRDITLDGSVDMQPDWLWIKKRSAAASHRLVDSVRGSSKLLFSDQNYAEVTDANEVQAFNSNGFQLGTDAAVNENGQTFVAWNWKAGTSFTNDASATGIGTIDSTGSVNTTSGFSIISYSGTGSNGTIAHGLGSAPQVVLIKERNGTNNWVMSHQPLSASLGDYTRFMTLNSNGAVSGAGNVVFQGSAFTSSVFNVGTSVASNRSGGTYIAYCFAEKQGYSKFGSYIGNGSADGTFVYLGFKPAFVIQKNATTSSTNWQIFDNKRNDFNVVDDYVLANTSGAEGVSTSLDFTSNGFKIRQSAGYINTSGSTYIYMCFASNPFTTSTGVPATAR